MRALSSGTNVNPGDADYPNGRVRDKVGATPGTILNEVLNGDIIQFFQKLIIDTSITPNGNPDNVSNGYQLMEALIAHRKLQGKVEITVTSDVAVHTMLDTTDELVVDWSGGATEAKIDVPNAGIAVNKNKIIKIRSTKALATDEGIKINNAGNLRVETGWKNDGSIHSIILTSNGLKWQVLNVVYSEGAPPS